MLNLVKFLNKVKTDNMLNEIKRINQEYPDIKLTLSFDFSNKTAAITYDNFNSTGLIKIISIKNFDWFEIENLISAAGDMGYETSIKEEDYPILQNLIDKTVKKMFVKTKEEFPGFIVKQYMSEKQYQNNIGELKGNYINFSNAIISANILLKKALFVNISTIFQGKNINIFDFQTKF